MITKNIQLEICTYNMESCLAAQNGGANRVELCASMPEGGITPSYALIERAKKDLSIDVMVMIRPRGGDFLYSDYEFEIMQRDVEICKQIGVKGIVFGILTAEGKVDKQRNRILVEAAGDLQTCFHRAIDMSEDYMSAARDIVDLGFTRILTSGAYNKAMQGIDNIKKVCDEFGDKIEIMAGSGVNCGNIKDMYEAAHPSAFHFSAKKIISGGMTYRNPRVSMGGFGEVSEYDIALSDINEIKRAKQIIDNLR